MTSRPLRTFAFSVIADLASVPFEIAAERLYDAGCDDATVSLQKGLLAVEFSREAKSFGHALRTAVSDVESAGFKVLQIEPGDLVTISDVAARAGLTRAAVSLYANGERGRAFPPPVARITTDSPLWDWVEVSRWLKRRGLVDRGAVVEGRLVRAFNRRASGLER